MGGEASRTQTPRALQAAAGAVGRPGVFEQGSNLVRLMFYRALRLLCGEWERAAGGLLGECGNERVAVVVIRGEMSQGLPSHGRLAQFCLLVH